MHALVLACTQAARAWPHREEQVELVGEVDADALRHADWCDAPHPQLHGHACFHGPPLRRLPLLVAAGLSIELSGLLIPLLLEQAKQLLLFVAVPICCSPLLAAGTRLLLLLLLPLPGSADGPGHQERGALAQR